MIWLTSDLHFNHANIIKFCNRPWQTVEEMNEGLIECWNAVVRPEDEVFVVGDFAFGSDMSAFARLRGNKHLIIGNHDEKNKKVLQLPWASQHHIFRIKHEDARVIACHYPMETWAYAHRGALHIHGHCHGSLKRQIPHRWDVGVDCRGFAPVAITDLVAWGKADMEYDPQDHHA